MNKWFYSLTAASCLAATASAQFSLTNVGVAYTQDFSSLPFSSDAASAFTNNSTLPGWSASGSASGNATAVAGVYNGSAFLASANTTPAEATYFLKAIQQDSDGNTRLGTRTGSAVGNFLATFQVTNNTGGTLNGFDLSYQGSQFLAREGGAIWVSFSTDGSNWTKIDALTYDAPVVSAGTNLNLSSTQIDASETDLSGSATGLAWADGTDLWVQWAFYRDVPGGSSGNSPVLAIDNVSFTAVPEPSTYAALAGLLALGLVYFRRRSKVD